MTTQYDIKGNIHVGLCKKIHFVYNHFWRELEYLIKNYAINPKILFQKF